MKRDETWWRITLPIAIITNQLGFVPKASNVHGTWWLLRPCLNHLFLMSSKYAIYFDPFLRYARNCDSANFIQEISDKTTQKKLHFTWKKESEALFHSCLCANKVIYVAWMFSQNDLPENKKTLQLLFLFATSMHSLVPCGAEINLKQDPRCVERCSNDPRKGPNSPITPIYPPWN